MGEKPVFLTAEGREKLEQELEHLQTVRRSEVAELIRAAKDEGDVTENAGYDEAKNEQAFVEGRILTIEQILKNAQIIERGRPSGAVTLGTTVTVAEPGMEQEVYTIVGSPEADPTLGLISNESPVGQAIMGHKVGDRVRVVTPDGTFMLHVLAIE
jgi:transcription elongation factor GreA